MSGRADHLFPTLSTIGYGDITPRTPGGRAFFCAWALVSATSLTIFFSILADAQFGRHTKTQQHSRIHRFVQSFRPSASRERRIREEEERARLESQHTETEPSSPRSAPLERPLSPAVVEEEESRPELVHLIRELRHQVDLLVDGGDSGAAEEMERVVAETMGRQGLVSPAGSAEESSELAFFSFPESQHVGLRTRDRVETSEELTRIICET